MGLFIVINQKDEVVFSRHIYSLEDTLRLNNVEIGKNNTDEERLCFKFIRSKMTGSSGGVFTNYLETGEKKDYATGHEMLSESIGLMMLYSIKTNDHTLFEEQFVLLERFLLMPQYMVRWRVHEKDWALSRSSATIDDLRIIRSLLLAQELWEDEKYSELALEISSGIKQYAMRDSSIVNYYCQKYDDCASVVDLSYIDLRTMAILSTYDKSWEKTLVKGHRLIEGGMISDEFPLYHRSYDYDRNSYNENPEINILDSLSTLLHLSETGKLDQRSIDWIYEQFSTRGAIYAKYSLDGQPLSTIESTAAYALIARIAKSAGDSLLYEKAMSKVLQFQVHEFDSPLNGAFGYLEELEVFSYDNLQALLAF